MATPGLFGIADFDWSDQKSKSLFRLVLYERTILIAALKYKLKYVNLEESDFEHPEN